MSQDGSKNRYHHGNLRQELIAEARRIIQEQGAHALTLRDLGKRLGVSRTAPYRHFKDRKALLSAVAEESARIFRTALQKARSGSESPLTRLRRMGRSYLDFAHRDPSGYRLMFQEPQLLQEPDPELKTAMNGAFEELQRMVEECQGAGVLKAGDPQLTATLIWANSHGIASLLIDDRLPPEIDVEQLLNFMGERMFLGIGRKSLETLLDRFS